MGRRALPKTDSSIDVSQHLWSIDQLTTPLDPQSLFPIPRPLEVEVGSGKGLFLLSQSERQPDRNFLGNEIAMGYARLAAYRLAMQSRTNARMIAGDGLQLFRELMPDSSVAAVHVYFPDPWWKARHRRRRVMQPAFIADIERVLVAEGELHFWTDVREYFDETVDLISRHSNLKGPCPVAETPAAHEMDYRTHFERRMRLNGHDVFRARYACT